MRPLDVLRTRRGLSVEVGNTDAEGRLVLCDLLAEASDERPDLMRGLRHPDRRGARGARARAAGAVLQRRALGRPPARAPGRSVHDPLWRLPLWDGYDSWLNSPVADLNNVSSKPLAGAIVAALFLRRFVAPGVHWAHIDLYAWNDQTPAGPAGRRRGARQFGRVCAA